MRPRAGLVFLERWWGFFSGFDQANREDGEQLAPVRLAYLEGAVHAYERLGLLSGEEAARWRQRLAEPEDEIELRSELGPEALAAAENYLAELVARVRRIRPWPDAAASRRYAECEAAIAVLHDVGVLDDEAESRWLAESWRRRSPWRTRPGELPLDGGPPAISLPCDNEPQAAEDAAKSQKLEMIRRVIIGSPGRQGDLAIVALVVHRAATSLHFHYLGGAQPDEQPFCTEPAGESLQLLSPPALQDDAGQRYKPVDDRPDAAGRAWWGTPRAHEREAITGYWLYTPAAPADAREFTIERAGYSWTLQGPTT